MKKRFAAWLALALMAALLPAAGGGKSIFSHSIPVPGDAPWPDAVLYSGGRLYLKARNSLYAARVGDTAFQKIGDIAAPEGKEHDWYGVYADDGNFWALDWEKGRLYPFAVENDGIAMGKPVALTDEHDGAAGAFDDPFEVFAAHGRLWMVFTDAENESILCSLEPETGKIKQHLKECLQSAFAGGDGKIFLVLPPADGEKANDGLRLAQFDIATGAVEEEGAVHATGYAAGLMNYEKETRSVLYSVRNAVYRRGRDGQCRRCAVLPLESVYSARGGVCAVPGGVACLAGRRVLVWATSEDALPGRRLGLYGSLDNETNTEALLALPDVSIECPDLPSADSAQALGQMLTTGEAPVDLMALSPDTFNMHALYQKGYCADLSGSEKIREYIGRVYPMLRDLCVAGGKIYAVPVKLSGEGFGVNKGALAAVGMEAPQTFEEMCAAVGRWEEIADENSKYSFISRADKSWPFEILMQTYEAVMRKKGEELKMDTPLFRRMAAAYEALRPVLDRAEWTQFSDDGALQRRYLGGQLDIEGYIREMDGLLHLMRLEK